MTKGKQRVFVVDANSIALKEIGKPIVNSAMLGAVAKATGAATLSSILLAVKGRFDEKNAKACESAFLKCQQL